MSGARVTETRGVGRRRFVGGALRTMALYGLLRLVTRTRALAEPVRGRLDDWARALDRRCRDVRSHALSGSEWQAEIQTLLGGVELTELLRAIDFETLERRLSYPDLGVDTQRVALPGFQRSEGAPSFHAKLFGLERDRAILPHGHRNMVSAHLVLRGELHLRQYQRVAEDEGGLVVRPTVDEMARAGSSSSISDEVNNVHWMIARGGRAHTLDVIVTGLDPERPEWTIDNLDPAGAERLADGSLRMPRLPVREALERYGKDVRAADAGGGG